MLIATILLIVQIQNCTGNVLKLRLSNVNKAFGKKKMLISKWTIDNNFLKRDYGFECNLLVFQW